jgi:lysylphosphatidylglycerol synthetase-like protein (DUF2156 family)
MAVAALILGIVALVFSFIPFLGAFVAFPLGIVAIILGVLGRSRAKQGAAGGGLAMGGIILGAVALLISMLWVIGATIFAGIFERDIRDLIDELEQFDPQSVGAFLRSLW